MIETTITAECDDPRCYAQVADERGMIWFPSMEEFIEAAAVARWTFNRSSRVAYCPEHS